MSPERKVINSLLSRHHMVVAMLAKRLAESTKYGEDEPDDQLEAFTNAIGVISDLHSQLIDDELAEENLP